MVVDATMISPDSNMESVSWPAGVPCRPSFMIIGAPKCGTTSLFTYVVSHPQVRQCAITYQAGEPTPAVPRR